MDLILNQINDSFSKIELSMFRFLKIGKFLLTFVRKVETIMLILHRSSQLDRRVTDKEENYFLKKYQTRSFSSLEG